MIIPSIDIMDGKAVQLQQGQKKIIEKENVFELAREFSMYGEIAVIDLDAAMGKGENTELIKSLCKQYSCRVGGGIRTKEKALEYLHAGASKIIIGTAANKELLQELPSSKIIVAIDTKKGKITTEGWQKVTENTPEEMIKELQDYCYGFLYTIVDKEGMMQGTELESFRKVSKLTNNKIIAAGGITTIEEIKALSDINADCQLGMCIYTGSVKLSDAFVNLVDFEKQNNLVPTIVQDAETKQVLMLAYSSKESLAKSFEMGKATYYSRSRNELWTKGLTSGNTQELLNVRVDCDRDTLLFTVNQNGPACHTNAYTCFEEDKDFNWYSLYKVLEDRAKKLPEKSYTTKLLKNDHLMKRKINEEAFEVITAKDNDELAWEVADLLYHVSVMMAKNNVTVKDIFNQLGVRHR
ncbi:MAG: bifunctional phosphoribosyl-AMP cyclohydrolase/phosphoribosyl-ATP diphosphatase HisIE [Vampirovibrionia bacterium]